MRVLITLQQSPPHTYLAHLLTKELIKEVRKLLTDKKHSKAIAAIIAKGRFEREISERDLLDVEADLILSEKNARWDLTLSKR